MAKQIFCFNVEWFAKNWDPIGIKYITNLSLKSMKWQFLFLYKLLILILLYMYISM